MIVYAGKQYGNEFNNGDEALFQDAERPRDTDKFKLRPGLQAQKNDLRTANSGIAAQGTFQGAKVQDGQSMIVWNTAYMKNSYTGSDFPGLSSFVALDGTTYNPDTVAKGLGTEIIGKPYVNAVDGDIVVGKNGVYAVTAQCIFIAPTGYSVANSANYKFYVGLIWNGQAEMWTQSRGCGSTDGLSVFYLGYFKAGDKVNVGFLHTYTTSAFVCQPSICLYRLS